MISSDSQCRRPYISDYFDALHGGKPPSDQAKPAQKPEEAVNTAQTIMPKPNQP